MSYTLFKNLLSNPKHKVALSLSGGGMGYRLINHVALLVFLQNHGFSKNLAEVWGVGMGALAGGVYATTLDAKKVFKLVLKMRSEMFRFRTVNFLKNVTPGLKRTENAGLFDSKILEKILKLDLGNQQSQIPFYALAFNINRIQNEVLYADQIKTTNDIIMASMPQAGIHPPKFIDKQFYLDGCMQEPLPLLSVYKQWLLEKEQGFTQTEKLVIVASNLIGFTAPVGPSIKPFVNQPQNYFDMLNFASDVRYQELVKYDLKKIKEFSEVTVVHLKAPTWRELGFYGFDKVPKALETAEKLYSLQLADEHFEKFVV